MVDINRWRSQRWSAPPGSDSSMVDINFVLEDVFNSSDSSMVDINLAAFKVLHPVHMFRFLYGRY